MKSAGNKLVEQSAGWYKAPFLQHHWYAPAGYLREFIIPTDMENWLATVIEGKWHKINNYLLFEREEDCKLFIMVWNNVKKN
jgi:hypothetical protein